MLLFLFLLLLFGFVDEEAAEGGERRGVAVDVASLFFAVDVASLFFAVAAAAAVVVGIFQRRATSVVVFSSFSCRSSGGGQRTVGSGSRRFSAAGEGVDVLLQD